MYGSEKVNSRILCRMGPWLSDRLDAPPRPYGGYGSNAGHISKHLINTS